MDFKIKTQDLWIYNFDKFNNWFYKRVSHTRMPLSLYSYIRLNKKRNKKFSTEVYLTSLLFHLYTQRRSFNATFFKINALDQVFSRGLNLLLIEYNKKPFVFSAFLCGVYDFNSTIAVKLGFKKDGLIKVSKKAFTRLFLEKDFVIQNYGFVDLISCPTVGFDNKFLDFDLILENPCTKNNDWFRSGISMVPDCVVFLKKSNRVKYAFSYIVDFGEVAPKYNKKTKALLPIVKGITEPYLFKILLLISRLVFSFSFFIKANSANLIKSNFFFYKSYKSLKRIVSLFYIFNSYIKKYYFFVHKSLWYKRFFAFYLQTIVRGFNFLKSKFRGFNLKKMDKEDRLLSVNFPLFNRKTVALYFNEASFESRGLSNSLFFGGKLAISKYNVRRFKDLFLFKYFISHFLIHKKVKLQPRWRPFFEKFLRLTLLKKEETSFNECDSVTDIKFSLSRKSKSFSTKVFSFFSFFKFFNESPKSVETAAFQDGMDATLKQYINTIYPLKDFHKNKPIVSQFFRNYRRSSARRFSHDLRYKVKRIKRDVFFSPLERSKLINELLSSTRLNLFDLFDLNLVKTNNLGQFDPCDETNISKESRKGSSEKDISEERFKNFDEFFQRYDEYYENISKEYRKGSDDKNVSKETSKGSDETNISKETSRVSYVKNILKEYRKGSDDKNVSKEYHKSLDDKNILKEYRKGSKNILKEYRKGSDDKNISKEHRKSLDDKNILKEYRKGSDDKNISKEHRKSLDDKNILKEYRKGSDDKNVSKETSRVSYVKNILKEYRKGSDDKNILKEYRKGSDDKNVSKETSKDSVGRKLPEEYREEYEEYVKFKKIFLEYRKTFDEHILGIMSNFKVQGRREFIKNNEIIGEYFKFFGETDIVKKFRKANFKQYRKFLKAIHGKKNISKEHRKSPDDKNISKEYHKSSKNISKEYHKSSKNISKEYHKSSKNISKEHRKSPDDKNISKEYHKSSKNISKEYRKGSDEYVSN